MPPKRALSTDDADAQLVADALNMMRDGDRASASPTTIPDKVRKSGVPTLELPDGSSLDLAAFIKASIESHEANKQAKELLTGTRIEPGSSGYKRPLDSSSTHKEHRSSKRHRRIMASTIDESGQGSGDTSGDEYESGDETVSEEDDVLVPYSFSSVFGAGMNKVPSHNTVVGDARDVARSEVSQSSPARLATQDGIRPVTDPGSRAHTQDLGDKGEVQGVVRSYDKDLYVPVKNTPNWSPPEDLLAWACEFFDGEWDLEHVRYYETKYVAPQEFRHLFTPIPITKAMDQALSSQYTKDTDKYFNRRETERMLFRAAKDICLAYGPIFKAWSMLGDRGDCVDERKLLSEGLLGVASAGLKITRARRELLRRYFDLGVAKELYDFNPSHSQFFGGNSLDDRVKEAKALADARNNLFFRPKPKSFNFKNQKYNKSAGFQEQNQQQKPQNKGRKGRGRGRRFPKGKGKGPAAKTSESK